MSKTLLYRIFGLGKVPASILPTIKQEGIVLLDEGIGGSVTFRKFRAPGRRYDRKCTLFSGSLVITEKRFWGFSFSRPVISVPMDDPKLKELHCSIKGENTLCVLFDVSIFHEGWSGTCECRFKTPKARLFLERIKKMNF